MKSGFRLSRIVSSFRPRRFLAAYLLVWLGLTVTFSFEGVWWGGLPVATFVSAVSAVCLAYLTLFGIPAYCLMLLTGRRTMIAYCVASLLAMLPLISFVWNPADYFPAVFFLAAGLESGLIAYFAIEPMRRVPRRDRLRRAVETAADRPLNSERAVPGWRAASLAWLAVPVVVAAVVLAVLDRLPRSPGSEGIVCKAQFDISQVREAERVVVEVAGRWGLAAEVEIFDDWVSPPENPEDIFDVDIYYDPGFFRMNDTVLSAGSWRGDGTVLRVDYRLHPAADEDAPDVDAVRLARDVMRTLEQRLGLSFRHDYGPRSATPEEEALYCSTRAELPSGQIRFSPEPAGQREPGGDN